MLKFEFGVREFSFTIKGFHRVVRIKPIKIWIWKRTLLLDQSRI